VVSKRRFATPRVGCILPGRDECQNRMRLLLDVVERRDDLHPEDLARVRAVSSAETDPADHSRASPHYADGAAGGRASTKAHDARPSTPTDTRRS
jgi:hypothetical protein